LNGEDEELTSILSVCQSFSNKKDNQNETPLHFAIEGNHLSTCELLLDFGADMFFKPNQRVRIYSIFLLFCHSTCFRFLLFFFVEKIVKIKKSSNFSLKEFLFLVKIWINSSNFSKISFKRTNIPNPFMINLSHSMNSILKYS